ncbi:MAG: tRNA lysidine(34) synthetase TilS [Parvularculaceae bacterium]
MEKGAHTPVAPDEFRAALDALKAPARVALAISGGPDSMALACLAAETKSLNAEIFAFTVDHGLRPDAADEAVRAGAWCAALGFTHQVLRWRGEKPASGVQEAARRARYRLLAEAANKAGAAAILTAHNLDDQAETVFMRLARGAGPQGLAAMAEDKLIAAGPGAPVRLLRPMLAIPRARLIATLAARRQDYVDDPSNEDPAFERVRVRALLAALEEQNLLSAQALARTADSMSAAARRLMKAEDRRFRRAGGCFYAWGGASVDVDRLDASFAPVLRRLIHAVSGADYPPREADCAQALSKALDAGAAALGGALLKQREPRLFVMREPAALTGRVDSAPAEPAPLPPNSRILWDGRFIVDDADGGPALEVAALGEAGFEALGPRAGLVDAPREALLATPAIWRAGAFLAAPALGIRQPDAPGVRARPIAEERYFRRILRF